MAKWDYVTDNTISLQAKGLLAIIGMQQQKSKSKSFGMREIAKQTSSSEYEIEQTFEELKAHGKLQPVAGEDTIVIDGVAYVLAEG